MLTRFEGDDGKRRLITALSEQALINGDESLAKDIASKAKLKAYVAGEFVIKQDEVDSDVYFIINGAVSVIINGREIAKRTAGSHVGEMALIDPTVRRSASIKALETTVVAILAEPDFSGIAEKHSGVWRRIAIELSNRLRERSKYIRLPNQKPMVFIASSKEMAKHAERIKNGIKTEYVDVNIWTEGIFQASVTAIESLDDISKTYDYGVVIFGSEDMVESRGIQKAAPRDNVVFEVGLLMGGLGRIRTFIVKPKELDIKIPSDLLGVTCLELDLSNEESLTCSLALMCKEINERIAKTGSR